MKACQHGEQADNEKREYLGTRTGYRDSRRGQKRCSRGRYKDNWQKPRCVYNADQFYEHDDVEQTDVDTHNDNICKMFDQCNVSTVFSIKQDLVRNEIAIKAMVKLVKI